MTPLRFPEENLEAHGRGLPQLSAPGGNDLSVRRAGAIVYLVGVSALPRHALVELQMTVRVNEA